MKQPIKRGFLFFFFFLQSGQKSNATETAPQLSILQPHHSLYGRLLLPSASSEFGQSQQVFLRRARSPCKGQEPFTELSVSVEIVASWAVWNVQWVEGREDKWQRCATSLCRRWEHSDTTLPFFPIQRKAYDCHVWLKIKATTNLSIAGLKHPPPAFAKRELNGDVVVTQKEIIPPRLRPPSSLSANNKENVCVTTEATL